MGSDPASSGSPLQMSERTVQVRITGRVQGVSYRAWTADAAAELGLRGWVRNRRDGSVEAIFSGPDVAVADMLKRCKSGPPAARVDRVAVTERPPGDNLPQGFDFRATTD